MSSKNIPLPFGIYIASLLLYYHCSATKLNCALNSETSAFRENATNLNDSHTNILLLYTFSNFIALCCTMYLFYIYTSLELGRPKLMTVITAATFFLKRLQRVSFQSPFGNISTFSYFYIFTYFKQKTNDVLQ